MKSVLRMLVIALGVSCIHVHIFAIPVMGWFGFIVIGLGLKKTKSALCPMDGWTVRV